VPIFTLIVNFANEPTPAVLLDFFNLKKQKGGAA
jgi:hypothetical protein